VVKILTENTSKNSVPIWLIILIVSFGMNICRVFVFGISDVGDSWRYYDSDESILNRQMLKGKYSSHLGSPWLP
jgi:hypothetical protein